ncbi:hypothetical protein THIOM_000018 [Candidatus Thiomargarita nelsonii]|uniref:Response regulatory domain-containing protein n=1 Tax=Candidatus Thiomargarita nelsonii TaxID=1003181 RepID=A0A0A6RLF3_9GAMM|nr:hypothetical protein THIOM_000018 [Candidatus Thiomargarita nelsonii]
MGSDGDFFEAGNCSTALSLIRNVDFFDMIILDQDEECPAFFELFSVIGELKPDAQVVVVSRGCGVRDQVWELGAGFLGKPVESLMLRMFFT